MGTCLAPCATAVWVGGCGVLLGAVGYKPHNKVCPLPHWTLAGGWVGSLWVEEHPGALCDPVVIHSCYEHFMPAYKEHVVQASVNAT